MKKITHPQPNTRAAFTLLELLAVITIISILLALILPTIGGAMRRAREAQVSAEISRFETAITSFKSQYGIEPWSEIVLTEDPGTNPWPSASKTKLRKIWPQYTFAVQTDFNNDGDTDDVLTLTGSESLVFFLGGVLDRGGLIGFSKNPINPFTRAGDNRDLPSMEFDLSRLLLDSADLDGDGMPEYLDPTPGQTTPYHFASSNNGQGYSDSVGHYLDQSDRPWMPDSHQIISPGEDSILGPATPITPVYTPETELSGSRLSEADNITNFSGGRLGS